MGRRVLLISCIRTVATFLLGFAIGAVFNLLFSASLPLSLNSPPVPGPWGAGIQDVIQGETGRVQETLDRQQILPQLPPLLQLGEAPESPRVLCYVLVGPSTHRTAVHVKNTWGQRCDRLVFFSTANDTSLKPDVLDVPEGYGYLWAKTKAGLTYLHENYPDYHWYLKADDDTYVIIENLRYFLQERDPNLPVYYGVKFRRFVKQASVWRASGWRQGTVWTRWDALGSSPTARSLCSSSSLSSTGCTGTGTTSGTRTLWGQIAVAATSSPSTTLTLA